MKGYCILFSIITLFHFSCNNWTPGINPNNNGTTPIDNPETNYFFNTDNSGDYRFLYEEYEKIGTFGHSYWYPLYTNATGTREWSIRVTKKRGHQDAGYGMIFRYGEENGTQSLLSLMIRINGEYQVGKIVSKAGSASNYAKVTEWTHSTALIPELNNENTLLVRQDTTGYYTVYMNGLEVTTFSDTNEPQSTGSAHGGIVVLSPHESGAVEVLFSRN